MNAEETAANSPAGSASKMELSGRARRQIFTYLGVLIILMDFGAPLGGLLYVPLSFVLKNKLHLEAHEASEFKLISSIPLYLSFMFGFMRDVWDPFGMKDRGFLMLFGGISAGLYFLFAFTSLSYVTLLVAVVLLTTSYLFMSAAMNGLASTIGQQHAISGQVSAVWNIFGSLVVTAALVIGGPLSEFLEPRDADRAVRLLFLIGAMFMASIAVYGAWRPRVVFDNVRIERLASTAPLQDLKRLVRHWPIYPAMLIWFLWNFAPGSDTPLQYYLQNTLGAKDAQWAEWNAMFAASFIPTFIGYGFLCRVLPLRTLLFGGTIIAVPQMVPLLFVDSINGAVVAALGIGLMGGVATAAYFDLIIRSCPRGLQGTTVMIAASLSSVAVRFGDRLGATLYDHFGGFGVCVLATTVV